MTVILSLVVGFPAALAVADELSRVSPNTEGEEGRSEICKRLVWCERSGGGGTAQNDIPFFRAVATDQHRAAAGLEGQCMG